MAHIRLDMTMSLDGYVAGPDDDRNEPMGLGGFRLFNWLDHRNEPGPHGDVYAEAQATRAVIYPGAVRRPGPARAGAAALRPPARRARRTRAGPPGAYAGGDAPALPHPPRDVNRPQPEVAPWVA